MRKLKSGFTLAEVLITIAVIGIVAAMTLPNMITGYQYKSIGVKLSKFAANTESSARAFVAANGAFSTAATNDDRLSFGSDSFLRVGANASTAFALATSPWSAENKYTAMEGGSNNIYSLKDGTIVAMASNDGVVLPDNTNTGLYGASAFSLTFDPHINGLPTSAQKRYRFIVTELGYVFPDKTDTCLSKIAGADQVYSSKSEYYTSGVAATAVCKKSAS